MVYLPLVRVFGHAADGFDRAVPLRHAREGVFDDHVGVGEGLGDVAALEIQVHGDVVRLVVVHQRRAVFHRFFGVEHAGQRLPIDFDQIDRFFGDIGIDGRHRRDFFADVAGLADGENILVGKECAPGPLDRVFGGDDGAHAGKFFRLAGVDVANARVRVGAAQNFADQHAGQINIGDEFGVAGDFVEALDALDALADDGKFFCFGHDCCSLFFRIISRKGAKRAKARNTFLVLVLGVFARLCENVPFESESARFRHRLIDVEALNLRRGLALAKLDNSDRFCH